MVQKQMDDNPLNLPADSRSTPVREPIAIIGIGCRFPGGVNNLATFWQLLSDEVDAIGEIPAGRFDVAAFYDPVPFKPGKIVSREGGFLDRIDQFDADFFGISPREASTMDPQQRLLLEVAWEALEDGGQAPDRLASSQTGVFVGMWTNDYEDSMYAATRDIDLYVTTGGGRYSASGRLSYVFDFRGPSLTVDTACSSSLVAVHLACHSLWNGESTLALAAGVNLILEPPITIGYSRSKMLSPDARCKFGDVRANGYVRSEGVGLVVLKPLSQALADRDRIHALIRGSAVNNDGRSSGLLVAPGVETQITMLREAYRQAGVSPGQVGYVEAHGTGTRIGDPIELQALGTILAEGRASQRPCFVGSIKTNIGHTEAASGMAGLIKTVLCLKHRTIPASLHFNEPNPNIPWSELPLIIPQTQVAWPEDSLPAFAGVNSFGITGTNAHIVLAEAPPLAQAGQRQADPARAYLVPFSAHTPQALRELSQAYKMLLTSANQPVLADLAYTASCRRNHLSERLALVATSPTELIASLDTFIESEGRTTTISGQKGTGRPPKIVFVCPGQGAQWFGMGRQLLAQEPVFREALERCQEAMQPLVDWSLLEQLTLEKESPVYRLDEISVIQPTLFAFEVALAHLWGSWGIEPDAVIGHSMGEVAAACIAGALSLEDAARVICYRSQLMQRVSGQGAMLAVGLSFAEAAAVLKGYEDRLSIAVHNSPRSTVLSGDPGALEEIQARLQAQDIFCRPVKVDVAAHSPQMEPLQSELVRTLNGLQAQAARIPIYSTVAQEASPGLTFNAVYWGANLRQPVRFSTAVERLLQDEYTLFVELSPHPILLPAIEETAQAVGRAADTVPSLRREQAERATMLESLGRLYTLGCTVDWAQLYPAGSQVVDLPAYPWQCERFWLTDKADAQDVSGWLYQLRWELTPHPETGQNNRPGPGTWLIFADKKGVGETLAVRLKEQGQNCILISPGETWRPLSPGRFLIHPERAEDMRQLLAAVLQPDVLPCRGVVHLWSLDIPALSELDAPALEAAQMLSCGSVLQLVQGLAQTDRADHCRLWLVTQGAQPALEAEPAPLAAAQAPLWGFGRAIAEEHPELWGKLIDLEPGVEAGQAAAWLHQEILAADKEDHLAFREGQRYAARLTRVSRQDSHGRSPSFQWRADSSYLITGGLGDIGGQVARWMVRQGARRLILLGRTPLPPRVEWGQVDPSSSLGRKIATIRDLEAMGASVHLAAIDVADEAQVRAFVDSFQRENWPPIRGVIHTAGILDNRLLLQLDLATLKRVLRPKVVGGWVLHHVLGDVELFLLFSSVIAVLVQPGQGNYAAANTFLDALAHYRRGRNQSGLSLNWGVWDKLGMIATASGERNVEQMRQQGLNSLTLPQGLETLEYLLQQDYAQVIAAPVNWSKFRETRAVAREFPLLADLIAETAAADQSEAVGRTEASLRQRLLAVEPEQRQPRLETYVRAQVARVLKLAANRLDPDKPFGSYGLDSLMALELRNHLETDLELTLSATLVWNHPTLNQLVPYLAGKMEISLESPARVTAIESSSGRPERVDKTEPGKIGQILAGLETISDEEAMQALLGKK